MSVHIPQGGGVPGISGPPDWLSAPPTGNVALDDVRWLNAEKFTFEDGASSAASGVRAVYGAAGGQQYIFVTFRAGFAPLMSVGFDRVYFGLRKTGENKAMVVRITVHPAVATFAGSGPPSANPIAHSPGIKASTRLLADVGELWTDVPPAQTPAWIDTRARVWVQTQTDDPDDPNFRWGVQLMIPVATTGDIAASAAANIGSDFEMWYMVHGTVDDGGSPAALVFGEHPAPPINTPSRGGKVLNGKFPNPFDPTSAWEQYLLSAGPASGGVAIYGNGYSDIRVRSNGVPEGTKIQNGAVNTFIARPRNYRAAGLDIPAGKIAATFRMANWGSLNGDPTQVNWASGTWQYIFPVTTPPIPPSTPLPSNQAIPTIAAASNPPTTVPGSNPPVPIEPITASTMVSGTGLSLHQCIYVTLSGPNLQFLNDSAFQNMDFDNTNSVLERDAEINVRGATPQPTEAILALEMLNMPKNSPGANEGQFLSASSQRVFKRGGKTAEKLKSATASLGHRDYATKEQRLAAFVDALSNANFTQAETEHLFPTIRMHVYHDTHERTTDSSGRSVRVFKAQSSFGVYVYHEGPLEGWQTSIVGAERTGDRQYRISIPSGGIAKIKIRVQGVRPDERRMPEDPIVKVKPGGGDQKPSFLDSILASIRRIFGG